MPSPQYLRNLSDRLSHPVIQGPRHLRHLEVACLGYFTLKTSLGHETPNETPKNRKVLMAIATSLLIGVSACSSNPSASPSASPAPDSMAQSPESQSPESTPESTPTLSAQHDSADNAVGSDNTDAEITEARGDRPSASNLGVTLAAAPFETLLPFLQEAERLNTILRCPEGKLYPPAFNGDGSLYKCVTGEDESLRIFLREDPQTESVKNLKILWIGNQIPDSESQSQQIIQALANYYGGDRSEDLDEIFWNNTNQTLETETLSLEYRHRADSGGNEHLLVMSPKP